MHQMHVLEYCSKPDRQVVVVVVVVTLFIHGKFISSVNYKILMIINTILKTKTILILLKILKQY